MFNEYAPALDGTLHEEVGIGTWRDTPPASDGGPNAPVKPKPLRVSITRQGVSAMNVIGPGAVKMLAACGSAAASCRAVRRCSISPGCGIQNSGAGQFRSSGSRGCCAFSSEDANTKIAKRRNV